MLPALSLLVVASCGDTHVDSSKAGIGSPGCAIPPDAGPSPAAPDAGAQPVTPDAKPLAQDAEAPDAQPTLVDAQPAPAASDGGGAITGGKLIALTEEQMRKIGGGVRERDPRTIYVFLGNRERTCRDPYMPAPPFCDSWGAFFQLPPELQQPGTWHVEDPRLNFHRSQTGPPRGRPDDCWGSGGNDLRFGDISLVEISDRFLVVRLDDVRAREWDGSGTYTVERCP